MDGRSRHFASWQLYFCCRYLLSMISQTYFAWLAICRLDVILLNAFPSFASKIGSTRITVVRGLVVRFAVSCASSKASTSGKHGV